jgi:Fe-S cluster assembly iron-binding protein IscA
MLTLTPSAAQLLKNALSKAEDVEKPRVRLGIVQGHVKLAMDRERPGDATVEHEDESLIVMDPPTSKRLGDRKLDVDESTRGLVLR